MVDVWEDVEDDEGRRNKSERNSYRRIFGKTQILLECTASLISWNFESRKDKKIITDENFWEAVKIFLFASCIASTSFTQCTLKSVFLLSHWLKLHENEESPSLCNLQIGCIVYQAFSVHITIDINLVIICSGSVCSGPQNLYVGEKLLSILVKRS